MKVSCLLFVVFLVSSCSVTQHSWLRHYAISWKVVGLIPAEVIGFFNWPTPSLRSIQPLTEMSTRNVPGLKGARHIRPTTSPPSVSCSVSEFHLGIHVWFCTSLVSDNRSYMKCNSVSAACFVMRHFDFLLCWLFVTGYIMHFHTTFSYIAHIN
jgi:hypothetical protein